MGPGADFSAPAGPEQRGVVKNWFDDKGYGFITPDGNGQDVFIHKSFLSGGMALSPGTVVKFVAVWNSQKNRYTAQQCTPAGPAMNGMPEIAMSTGGGGQGGYG